MEDPSDRTVELLNAWHAGEEAALEELLKENQGWMRGFVRKKLPERDRRRFDSVDVVQDGLVKLLRNRPRYAPANRKQFRGLIAAVLEGALGDRLDRAHAAKRDVGRDEALPSKGLSRFVPLEEAEPSPGSVLDAKDRQRQVHAALEQLSPDDAQVIRLRQLEGLPFDEVAKRIGLANADAARMRYHRALPRLGRLLPRQAPEEAG